MNCQKAIVLTVLSSLLLVACGGGGGTSQVGATPPPAPTPLALMVDSLGRPVAEADFGGGDSGAAGADGSAGDGAPIANAPVTIVDNAGHSVSAKTDAQGYYRVNIKGFTAPLVARVTRPDGSLWYSHSVTSPITRGFVTMNVTGLTDKVGSYVAAATNTSGGAEKVTPAVLAANTATLQSAKTLLATGLTSPLTYVGIDSKTFDPVSTPYQAVKNDNYDRLLERMTASKDGTNGRTVVVATFAGVHETFVDGTVANATFSNPQGVAVDKSGNVYVVDRDNYAIRKITPAGMVSTLAGGGPSSPGFLDGAGTAARFRFAEAPYTSGIAVDGIGNLYVSDSGNNAVRKITPAGVVSTLAGNGQSGSSDGIGTTATFNYPIGVAVDGGGTVYVIDVNLNAIGNNAIRKITPAGVVSTLIRATPTGPYSGLDVMQGIAVDGSGNVYVANWGSVVRITPTGDFNRFGRPSCVKCGGDISLQFTHVTGIAVDGNGTMFVVDEGGSMIFKITPEGVVSKFTNGSGTEAAFNHPNALALDSNGTVYVADTYNQMIRSISPTGMVSTLAGLNPAGFRDGTGTAARFAGPKKVALDRSGNAYVADSGNRAIRKVTPAGVVSTLAGKGVGGSAYDMFPTGVAVDGNGNVYVADFSGILKITPTGVVSVLAGGGARGFSDGIGTAAKFSLPNGVAVDGGGNVFVADIGNNAIRKITPEGVVSTLAGSVQSGFSDGIGTAATFNLPSDVAMDGNGNVYVVDTWNSAIRKITATGVVSTLATGIDGGYSADTGGGIAVDGNGNLYVAGSTQNSIYKVTATGIVSTISGDKTAGYTNDSRTAARFSMPQGVAVDTIGNLYVADTGNHAIRIILP